jgi:hypothetical protein
MPTKCWDANFHCKFILWTHLALGDVGDENAGHFHPEIPDVEVRLEQNKGQNID